MYFISAAALLNKEVVLSSQASPSKIQVQPIKGQSRETGVFFCQLSVIRSLGKGSTGLLQCAFCFLLGLRP